MTSHSAPWSLQAALKLHQQHTKVVGSLADEAEVQLKFGRLLASMDDPSRASMSKKLAVHLLRVKTSAKFSSSWSSSFFELAL